jgi:hypothetical protein
MRKLPFVLLAALAAPASGCIVEGHRGHVSAGIAVAPVCDHHFLFYPAYDAYCCGDCGFWWVLDGGTWVRWESRPSHIQVGSDVVVVRVEERDPEPWVHYEDHRRRVPPGWTKDKDGGPPPGRGWKK